MSLKWIDILNCLSLQVNGSSRELGKGVYIEPMQLCVCHVHDRDDQGRWSFGKFGDHDADHASGENEDEEPQAQSVQNHTWNEE